MLGTSEEDLRKNIVELVTSYNSEMACRKNYVDVSELKDGFSRLLIIVAYNSSIRELWYMRGRLLCFFFGGLFGLVPPECRVLDTDLLIISVRRRCDRHTFEARNVAWNFVLCQKIGNAVECDFGLERLNYVYRNL